MKKLLLACCCITNLVVAFAQNNTIFKGGAGDGHVSKNYSQSAISLFTGGSGDGYAQNAYIQNTVALWLGGQGDGYAKTALTQKSISLWLGGAGDGHADSGYVQASISFYKGGGGDGWANDTTFYNPDVTVPITLLSFDASKLNAKYSLLKWKTASNANSERFEIERGNDGIQFTKMGLVKAASSSAQKEYSLVDSMPVAGFNYYRIKQFDRHGKFIYSPARLVKFESAASQSIHMYPNPAQQMLTIELPASIRYQNAIVNIIDMKGVVVSHIKLAAGSSYLLKMNLNKLPKAAYIVHISTPTYTSSQTLLVQ